MTDVAKVVTWLGAPQVAWPVVGLLAAVLALRGQRLQAAWLLAGLALTILFVHEIKIWVDRPRPAHPLVHTSGRSFPSGHAAYASAYVAVALAARRRALVIAAVLIAVVVAWSRVELRAHFVTDVLGGAALSALCFGATWLAVARLRHNGEA